MKSLFNTLIMVTLSCVLIQSADSQLQTSKQKINVRDFGAKGDGVTDDTAAIKLAISAVKYSGGTVHFPAGVYIVGLPSPGTGGYLNNFILPLVSNLTLEGSGEHSILKIRDNLLSTTDDNKGNAHLMTGKRLANVTIRNLTFDGNGSNNLTPAGHIRNAMFISLEADNITIENNIFKNCAGHNMIATSGAKAVIQNNRLINGGHYVGTGVENRHNKDFSFMYIASSNSVISGNIIEQENPDIALRGWSGGIELHGSSMIAQKNTIRGCNPAVYIANDSNSTSIDVSNNKMEKCLRGIVFWNTDHSMKDITLTNNIISLYRPPSRHADVVYGIGQENGGAETFSGVSANGGYVENLSISGNTIASASPPQSPAIQGIRLHSIKNGRIEYNTIDGLPDIGIALSGSPWGISGLTISNNKVTNCGSSQPVLAAKAALYIATHGFAKKPARPFYIKNVLIEKNEFGNTHYETLDSNGKIVGNQCRGDMLTGIVLAGYEASSLVDNVIIRDNSYSNLIWKLYGTTNPVHPEQTNPGFKALPDIIYATEKPLKNRQVFGDELIFYPDGSRYKCTQQGYFSNKAGYISGKEGSTTVECDNSNGLRVGMYIVITNAGLNGSNLYTFIRGIQNNYLVLTDAIRNQGGVTSVTYSIIQPVLTAM